MASRTFTLQEAHALLPVLESLLRRAMERKQLAGEIEQEFQELAQRIFLSGGMLLPIAGIAKRRAVRDKALQEIKDSVAEIDAAGVQVKDLDVGLLDFPCLVDDRIILLCWKMGEERITHWHGTDEGFAARKPIDQTILKREDDDVN